MIVTLIEESIVFVGRSGADSTAERQHSDSARRNLFLQFRRVFCRSVISGYGAGTSRKETR